jgi:hypothetical protein
MDRPAEDTTRHGDLLVLADPLDLLVHDEEWTLVPRDVDDGVAHRRRPDGLQAGGVAVVLIG